MGLDNHIIICVGRQVGSGGHDIARMLSLDFNAKYYDRELLNLAAKESGFSEKFFAQHDERRGVFHTLFNFRSASLADSNLYGDNFSQESLFKFQGDAILKAAEEGPCVFVGRCADYVLRQHTGVVNLFISAPLDFRVKHVMVKQKLEASAARRFIEKTEASRAAYYNYYTGKKWGAAESYDFCIDSSVLGITATEKLLAEYIRRRMGTV